MNHMLLEREFQPPISHSRLLRLAADSADCLPLYHIVWQESFLADNGRFMLCHFDSPDAESLRMVMRNDQALHKQVWQGSYHPGAEESSPNVLVARRFAEPVAFEDLQAQESSHQGCLDTYRVRFVASFFSRDHKRMICLYRAPDAESVRRAQYEAGMPVERVWSCRHILPDKPVGEV